MHGGLIDPCPANLIGAYSDTVVTLTIEPGNDLSPIYHYRRASGG